MNNPVILYSISILLALLPAAIWLGVLFQRTKRRGLQILIFIISIFTVVPVIFFQYFLHFFPQFNLINFLQAQSHDQNVYYIALFIGVGITEEIAKQSIIRFLDRRYLLIQTINESIQFSIIAALGFSFTENVFYIYNIWTNLGVQQLFVAYLFRSIFTTCAHMIFSGFFGYFYGIGKFSLSIRQQSRWIGKKLYVENFFARVLNMSQTQAFKEVRILKGLFIAMSLHAIFNFLLQLNQIFPVVIYVSCLFLWLRHVLHHKSGRLILVTDIDQQRASSMPKKDEDVVVELLGMWFTEGRFVDVIHICERLLERDPDNKVVQLFKAQAIDKLDNDSVYSKILKSMFPKKEISIEKMVKEKSLPKP